MVLLALVAQSASILVPAHAVSSGLVISQVYGGGGNSGAPYTHDFVEIYNGSSSSRSVGGLSIQYASATGTGHFGANTGQLTELPTIDLAPGGYFLVQMAGGPAGAPLPIPDFIDATPINMAASAGKVALVNGISSLGCNGSSTPCSPTQEARIIDRVGYGSANYFEGSSAAPTVSNTTSIIRTTGNVDTDQNGSDFQVYSPPTPRHGGVVGDPTLSINDVSISEGNSQTELSFRVSLSHPADRDVFYSIATQDESARAGLDYEPLSLTGQVIPAGSLTAIHDVRVYGDLLDEPSETFLVVLSGLVNAMPGDTTGRGTITNDDIPLRPIHELQGDGETSPFVNSDVATRGLVTARKTNGFFIQTLDAEDDDRPETSEGLFVFTNSGPTVAVGDEVRVSGHLAEFRSSSAVLPGTLTEITGPSVELISSGNQLPAAIDVAVFTGLPDNPRLRSRAEQLERFEGMLVAAPAMDVVGPTNLFGELYAVDAGKPRTVREPGVDISEMMPVGAPSTIDRFDGNFERLMLDSDDLIDAFGMQRPRLNVAVGARIQPVSGPLDYAFDNYRVALDAPAMATGGRVPTGVPTATGAEFTIAALNLENFRDLTPDFANRMQKASRLIVDILRTPDILGLIEVGDLEDLQELAALVNAAAGTAYEAYLLDGDGQSTSFEQNIGYLVNIERIEVSVAPLQMYHGKTYDFAGQTGLLLHDRPPLVLEARVRHSGTALTVILNHLRSLIGVSSHEPIGGGFTEGERVREKRRLQAEDVADLIQSRSQENLVVLGDMNAFEFNDGLVDVVGTLKGSPAPAEEVVEPSLDRWTFELADLVEMLPQPNRHSYVFEGNAQVLDHVLVNGPMLARLSRFLYARSNADFPEVFESDFMVTTRLSDHDAPAAYFLPVANLGVTAATSASVTAGGTLTLQMTAVNAGDTASGVSLSAMLPSGMTLQSTTTPAGWSCHFSGGTVTCQAASLVGGDTVTMEIVALVSCAVADGTVLAVPFTIGSATAEADVSDNTTAASAAVTNPSPAITGASTSRKRLLLPLHQMVPVTVFYEATDGCGPVATALSVTSDEPVRGPRQGFAGLTSPDWQVIDAHHVRLRAERSLSGDGRVYTITITAIDLAGRVSTEQASVIVPRHILPWIRED